MKGGALLTQGIRYLVFAGCNCERKVKSKHGPIEAIGMAKNESHSELGPIEAIGMAKNESHSELREK